MNTCKCGRGLWKPRTRTTCKDGTTLSIQYGDDGLYSTPRVDDGEYTHVEVGFITDGNSSVVTPPESWREYADGSSFPCDVYGYVPIELVEEFIQLHGGRKFYV